MARTLVTSKELAEALKVHIRTVQEWGMTGKIPRVILGHRTIRYDLEHVMEHLCDLFESKPNGQEAST